MSTRIVSLTCYICGRGYGSASIQSHMRTCPTTFLNNQKHLPVKLQIPVPDPPKAELPTSLKNQALCKTWNDEAYEIALNCRNKCPYCGRGFNPDSLIKHLHNCSKKPADADATSSSSKKTSTGVPNFFICGICGREYGTASIRKHLPVCYEQFQNDQRLIDKAYRRPLPDLAAMQAALEEIFADGKVTKAEIAQQRLDAQAAYKQGLAECPNCHRTFESLALEKHMKGCKVREFTFGLVLDDSIDDADADDATDSAHEAEHESDAEK